MDVKIEIATIRKIIKSKPELKNVRVQNGRGTAWGWVEIYGNESDGGYMFTPSERMAFKQYFHIGTGSNFAVISPDDRSQFIEKYS